MRHRLPFLLVVGVALACATAPAPPRPPVAQNPLPDLDTFPDPGEGPRPLTIENGNVNPDTAAPRSVVITPDAAPPPPVAEQVPPETDQVPPEAEQVPPSFDDDSSYLIITPEPVDTYTWCYDCYDVFWSYGIGGGWGYFNPYVGPLRNGWQGAATEYSRGWASPTVAVGRGGFRSGTAVYASRGAGTSGPRVVTPVAVKGLSPNAGVRGPSNNWSTVGTSRGSVSPGVSPLSASAAHGGGSLTIVRSPGSSAGLARGVRVPAVARSAARPTAPTGRLMTPARSGGLGRAYARYSLSPRMSSMYSSRGMSRGYAAPSSRRYFPSGRSGGGYAARGGGGRRR